MTLRVLTLDIETRPSLAWVWSLWPDSISTKQVVEAGEVIGVGVKWVGEKGTTFYSTYHHGKDAMLQAVWELLDEADVVVTWNGKRFDIPWLQQEFLQSGRTPPAPFEQVDLYMVAKRRFRFISNKLDFVAKSLGYGGKLKHDGFDLWIGCMKDDPAAWAKMSRYCQRDVVLTERIYHRMLPWIPSHPHAALDGRAVCPTCAGQLERRGTLRTRTRTYWRYKCKECGAWSRSVKSEGGASIAQAAL